MKYNKFVKPAMMNPYVAAMSENPNLPAAAARPTKSEKYSRTLSR
jgi:hypothetical protein